MKDLRQHWAGGRPTHGLWSLLPGAVTVEVLARTGADYVVVDLQHGAVSEGELPGITAAIRAAGLDAETVNSLVEHYEDAQLDALKTAFLFAALIVLASFWATRRLPTRLFAELESGPDPP